MPLNLALLGLDKRIDKFAKMLQQHYDLDDLGDPAVVTEVSPPAEAAD